MRPALSLVAVAAAALVGQAGLATPVAAQAPAASSVWLGAGGVVPLAQPDADRNAGVAALLALDVPVVPHLTVRMELSADEQSLRGRAGGPLSGDHQHLRTIAVGRYAPLAAGGLSPYLLGGGGVFWQSDRFILRDLSNPVPDAAYRQTTSRAALGAVLGAGLTAEVARTRLFAEARWMRVGGIGGATTDVGVFGGVTLPIAR